MNGGVRISGLVRLAQSVRREIGAGVAPARKAQLQRTVHQSVARVDEILRNLGAQAAELPEPSRRAYRFLKEIAWDAVAEDEAAPAAPQPLRWTGLGRFADRIAWRLSGAVSERELEDIARSLEQMSRRIELSIQQAGSGPGQLTAATRQWRAWFAWLGERENLSRYIAAVGRAREALGSAAAGRPASVTLALQFRPIRHIFKMQLIGPGAIVQMPTAMIVFDERAFAELGELMFGGSRQAKHRVGERMRSPEYADLADELEALEGVVEGTRGAFHDLAQSFERVNARYFGGRMARPRLTWSRSFTGRKFGHYDHVKDWVMVSSTLDGLEVPVFVVDFLMFHELLHKKHGVRWANERRMAHTREFYAEERTFERYGEAEEWLTKLART